MLNLGSGVSGINTSTLGAVISALVSGLGTSATNCRGCFPAVLAANPVTVLTSGWPTSAAQRRFRQCRGQPGRGQPRRAQPGLRKYRRRQPGVRQYRPRQCRSRQLGSDRGRAGPGQCGVGQCRRQQLGVGQRGRGQYRVGQHRHRQHWDRADRRLPDRHRRPKFRCRHGLFNSGAGNVGFFNTGTGNFGLFNSGSFNTGVGNSGNGSTGLFNSGSFNTGVANAGSYNTGSFNVGDTNTGGFNPGSINTGWLNAGNANTGVANAGNVNTGAFVTGNFSNGILWRGDYQGLAGFAVGYTLPASRWAPTSAAGSARLPCCRPSTSRPFRSASPRSVASARSPSRTSRSIHSLGPQPRRPCRLHHRQPHYRRYPARARQLLPKEPSPALSLTNLRDLGQAQLLPRNPDRALEPVVGMSH